MQFPQCFDKIIFRWHNGRTQYQYHHNLPCHMPDPNENMTQKPISAVFVIRTYFKGFQQSPYGYDNLICLPILNQTTVHRNNAMTLLLINSGNHLMPPVLTKCRMYFIAIIKWLLHGNNRFRPAIVFHKFSEYSVFYLKLLLIIFINPLTPSAFRGYRTHFSLFYFPLPCAHHVTVIFFTFILFIMFNYFVILVMFFYFEILVMFFYFIILVMLFYFIILVILFYFEIPVMFFYFVILSVFFAPLFIIFYTFVILFIFFDFFYTFVIFSIFFDFSSFLIILHFSALSLGIGSANFIHLK